MIILIKNKKVLLIAISIVIVVTIVAVLLIIGLNKDKKPEAEEKIDVEQLEIQFNNIFNNTENEYISTMYHIEENKSGKYDIKADIPYIHIDTNIDNKINKEINDIFIKKLLQIINKGQNYTVLKLDYTTSINKDILSLAIRCVLKEGSNAQRTIIKTYNYDLQKGKTIKIMEIIPEQKQEEIQEIINKRIQGEIKREKTIIEQGYNVYRRDPESDIYKLENATEFYIENNILYIIYCYGNNNYTSKIDIIITSI